MKVTTINSLVVGSGAKAKTIAPGTTSTAKKLGLKEDECRDLHDRGVIVIVEGADEKATEGDDPLDKQVDGSDDPAGKQGEGSNAR